MGMSMSDNKCIRMSAKVIHPKYYKHLKKGAHQNHLDRQKMGWFLADLPANQVKLKYETK